MPGAVWNIEKGTKQFNRRETYGFPSLPAVDNAMAFGSRKPAATASSNHLRNCKKTCD